MKLTLPVAISLQHLVDYIVNSRYIRSLWQHDSRTDDVINADGIALGTPIQTSPSELDDFPNICAV